jgi:hypothetical protein
VTREDHLSSRYQGAYLLLTANVAKMKPHSTRQDVGKAMKYSFVSVLRGMRGRRVTFIQF